MLESDGCQDISIAFREIELVTQRATQIVEQGIDARCCILDINFSDFNLWQELVEETKTYFCDVVDGKTVQGRDLLWHILGRNVFAHLSSVWSQRQLNSRATEFEISLSYIETYYIFFAIRSYATNAKMDSTVQNKWRYYANEMLKQSDNQLVSVTASIYVSQEMEILRNKTSGDSAENN